MIPSKNVVFILSSTHSGSTWLGYVLASAEPGAFLGEYFRGWHPEARVPCSWCASLGLEQCTALGGFESVPVEEAFQFAFQHLQRPVLIDASKTIAWTERFLDQLEPNHVRLVHLIREPRGWLASQRRRVSFSSRDLISWWLLQQREIAAFLTRSGAPAATVFYDELAAQPLNEFPRVFDFADLPFSAGCLNYWEKEHHGFAANGASSFVLAGPNARRVFVTGDDAFYEARKRTLFRDLRWKAALTRDEIDDIESNPEVIELLGSYGRHLAPGGLEAAAA